MVPPPGTKIWLSAHVEWDDYSPALFFDLNRKPGLNEQPLTETNPESRVRQSRVETRVLEACEPLLTQLGYECVFLEFIGSGKHGILRFYIDKPGGATIDDCVQASRQLEVVLDVDEPITASYRLEVSTPGVDRPLGRFQDFETYAGQTANIKTRQPISNRRNWSGVLAGIRQSEVLIEVEGETVPIPFSEIKKAHLKYSFSAQRGSRS